MKSKQIGFTLLELLVLLLIIGLLAGFVGPKYFSQIGRSEQKVAKAQIEAFDKALDQYRVDTGHYPNTENGLQALSSAPPNEVNWHGPYLKKGVPPDPWGEAYEYKSPGDNNRDFDIISYGKDHRPGGDGESKDIVSWE